MAEQGGAEIEVNTQQDTTALMEEVLERLRLLNYEKEFLKSRGLKKLTTAYFAVAGNPSEQFNYFKTLVKWLLQLCDVQGNDFSKYDDPMTVSTNILTECKKIGLGVDCPPIKLKSGSGDVVLDLLSKLSEKALKKAGFVFKKPKFESPAETVQEAPDTAGDNVDLQEQVIDAEIPQDDDGDEQHMFSRQEINEDKQVIQSNIPQKEWLLECQRVAPKLKVDTKTDSKDWRARVEATRNSGENIKKQIPDSRVKLEKLTDELTKTLEKIYKSEKVINTSMSDIGTEYRTKSEDLKKLGTHYNNLNSSIKEMNESYRVISEKLQTLLAKTNEHSGTMTDSSPVVKIKAAIQKLLTEIKVADVRIGVLNHTVLQHRTKEKRVDERQNGMGIHIIDEFDEN